MTIEEQVRRIVERARSESARDGGRFIAALKLAAGKRLTYYELPTAYETWLNEAETP